MFKYKPEHKLEEKMPESTTYKKMSILHKRLLYLSSVQTVPFIMLYSTDNFIWDNIYLILDYVLGFFLS